MIAKRWGCTREEMEAFSLKSHQRAITAQDEGRFDNELSPLLGVTQDEGPRRDRLEKMASLDVLMPEGRITAACSSQISDGAAALLVASRAALDRYELTLERVHHPSVRSRPDLDAHGADPCDAICAEALWSEPERDRPSR